MAMKQHPGAVLPRAAALALLTAGCAPAVAFLSIAPGQPSLPVTVAERHTVRPTGAEGAAVGSAAWATIATAGVGAAGAASQGLRRAAKAGRRAAAAEKATLEALEEPPFNPAKEPGATLPLMFFDPLGFSKIGDREGFRQFRSSELKHGRVAMIAALGAVVQHNIKFPGFEAVPSGVFAAITPPGAFGFLAVVALSGAVELAVWVQDPNKEPGNFGDPLKLGQYYDEWRHRELNNGRMAMLSIAGIVAAELATGRDGIEQIWQPLANLPVE